MRSAFTFLFFILSAAASADPVAEKIYKKFSPALVKIEQGETGNVASLGTGFFINKKGDILTNAHVAVPKFGGMTVLVTDASGKSIPIKGFRGCLENSVTLDLCIISTGTQPKVWIPVHNYPEKDFRIGRTLYALGHPMGLEKTLSVGVLSQLHKEEDGVELVQFSVPISPGSSGGPVFDDAGRFVAISTLAGRADLGAQNLNFGQSANTVRSAYKKKFPLVTEKDLKTSQAKVSQQLLQKYLAEDAQKTPDRRNLSVTLHSSGLNDKRWEFISLLPADLFPKAYCSSKANEKRLVQYVCTDASAQVVFVFRIVIEKLDAINNNLQLNDKTKFSCTKEPDALICSSRHWTSPPKSERNVKWRSHHYVVGDSKLEGEAQVFSMSVARADDSAVPNVWTDDEALQLLNKTWSLLKIETTDLPKVQKRSPGAASDK
jgi:hypothetical protein